MDRQDSSAQLHYAAALYEKALILRQRGDLTAAEKLFRQVLDLQERSLGREHLALLSTLTELGTTLIDLEKPREAEPLLRRALRLTEQMGDLQGEAEALGVLALAQAAQGFVHARATARRALQAWAKTGYEPTPALHRELEAIAEGAGPHSSGLPHRRG